MNGERDATVVFVVVRFIFDLARKIQVEVFRDRFLSDMFAGLRRTIIEFRDNIHARSANYPPAVDRRIAKHRRAFKTNFVVGKYILPFHTKEWTELLNKSKRRISVEANFTSQFVRYVRAETGISMHAHINKYDGEPLEPLEIVNQVKAIMANKAYDYTLTEKEARDIAYHYLRTHYAEKMRPSKVVRENKDGKGEPCWRVELVERTSGDKQAEMIIGAESGATYSFEKVGEPVKA